MLMAFLIIYAVVGLLFLAGVAVAAKRPMPKMESKSVLTSLPQAGHSESGDMWRKAA